MLQASKAMKDGGSIEKARDGGDERLRRAKTWS
jgi:hypothetical protein